MKTNFDSNFWLAIIALAISLYTFFNQQDFQASLEKEVIQREILKEARNIVMRNGSRINVIILLELREYSKENLNKEVLKELFTLQTEIVFNYLSIRPFLGDFYQESLDKDLESIEEMFIGLIDNQHPPGSANKYSNAIQSFSEGIVEELDKILLETEDSK